MKKHLILGGNLKTSLSSLGYKNFKVIKKKRQKSVLELKDEKMEHLIHKNINTTCASASFMKMIKDRGTF